MLAVSNRFAGTALLLFTALFGRAAVPESTQAVIDRILKQKGAYVADEGVYKVVIPREAAVIVRDWESMPPNLGLNSWFAFSSAIHQEAILGGEILLLPDEVDPVVTRVLDAGLEITGLSESSTLTGRRLYTLDLTGRGTFTGLVNAIRASLDQIQSTRREADSGRRRVVEPTVPDTSAIDADPLNAALAMRGTVSGGVYKAAIGRKALFAGERVGREMGMSTWISISGTNSHALAHGEVIATSDELRHVLRALRSKGASVVSIRNHMFGEHPEMIFIGYWARGPALELAHMLRFVLEVQIGNIEVPPAK